MAEEKKKEERTELTKFDENYGVAKMLQDAQILVSSKLLPEYIKTPEQAVTIMQMGKELGFKPMNAFTSIYMVGGKPTLEGKAMNAILLRGGVRWKTIQDAEPVYGGADGKQVTDRITKIKFTRKFSDGEVMEEYGTFSWTEAHTAGYLTKDNWKKHLRSMLWWRAFAIGAKRIAEDLILGMPETTELLDNLPSKDVDYEVVDDEVKIVQKVQKNT